MGYYDDYLEHHGILGQKWGVRRFENKNGTLTAAGKKRYTTDANGDYQKVKKSFRTKRLEKAANAAQRDADDLRKHGLTEEADAVQKVADKNRAKAEVSANKKGLTDKQKKVIIAGAAIAGTALAAYGGYKLYQLNEKAKEGMSKEYHKKAVDNRLASNKLNELGFDMHDQGFKTARESGADSGNRLMDVGKSYMNEASLHRDLADQYDFKANSKKYSVKEKYNYLKTGKVEDSALSKLTKSQIEDEHSRRSGIEKKYAEQRRQKELEAQKAFRAAQNTNYSTAKPPAGMNTASKMAWKASQSLAKNLTPPGAKTINSGKKTVTNTTKIHGQEKFSQAAKANDDLVNDLLKKNAQMLKGF